MPGQGAGHGVGHVGGLFRVGGGGRHRDHRCVRRGRGAHPALQRRHRHVGPHLRVREHRELGGDPAVGLCEAQRGGGVGPLGGDGDDVTGRRVPRGGEQAVPGAEQPAREDTGRERGPGGQGAQAAQKAAPGAAQGGPGAVPGCGRGGLGGRRGPGRGLGEGLGHAELTPWDAGDGGRGCVSVVAYTSISRAALRVTQ